MGHLDNLNWKHIGRTIRFKTVNLFCDIRNSPEESLENHFIKATFHKFTPNLRVRSRDWFGKDDRLGMADRWTRDYYRSTLSRWVYSLNDLGDALDQPG